MTAQVPTGWQHALATEWQAPYFQRLMETVTTAYRTDTIYPPQPEVFNAFRHTDFADTRVVIIGQDPYHGPGQAHGLAFSVAGDMPIPPSLRNIYTEIAADTGHPSHTHSDLTAWADQGVLLLNATLTVRAHKPASHHGLGWERFTDAAISALATEREHLVFMLWGRSAQEKGVHIDTKKHLVLTAPHPSPLSAHRGFFGCRHFSQCNTYLAAHGHIPITW